MANALYPKARHTEAITRTIVRCYADHLSIQKTAEKVSMDERQVGRIFAKIRAALSPHIEELVERHRSSAVFQERYSKLRELAPLVLAGQFSGAMTSDGVVKNASKLEDADRDRVETAKELFSGNSPMADRVKDFFAGGILKRFEIEYIKFFIAEKRGFQKTDLDIVKRELFYRYIICLCFYPHMFDEDEAQKLRTGSDGSMSIEVRPPNFKKIFSSTKEQGDAIERDILGVLEQNPLV